MSRIFHYTFKTFSSMKTGLVLLALLALFSAVGSSILPDRFYHHLLFNILIILLFFNLGLCTINRCLKLRKLLGAGKDLLSKVRQWGWLILHSGLMLILIGGMINNWAGQSGTVRLAEGEKAVIAEERNGEAVTLRLEAFEIELYDNNMPSQYLSRVSVFKGDQLEQQETIRVNYPLRYDGIKIYQQSHGSMVGVTLEAEGKVMNTSAVEGQLLNIPGSSWGVKVFKYVPDFDPSYGMESKSLQPNNPRIIYSIYQEEQLLGVGAAPFGERIEIDSNAALEFNGLKSYSVFKVKEDPGLPYAGAGGILFMLGVVLAELGIFRRIGDSSDRKTREE